MEDLEFAQTYLDNLLFLSKGCFYKHLKDTEKILKSLKAANMRIHAGKSSDGETEIDYLGYVVTREGIKPQQKRSRPY